MWNLPSYRCLALNELNESRVNDLEKKAALLRRHVVEMVFAAGSGHPGGSLSSADIITALFFEVMDHSPQRFGSPDRDHFILSKGHAAPVYYAALAECGYFPVEELKTLRQLHSRLQGHPSRVKTPGVEMSTGSLGQGLSVANGLALALRLQGLERRVFCLCGDGEMAEGQIWEAAMFAAHYHLDNVLCIVDRNGMQIDGRTEEIMSLEPLGEKWKAFGWHVLFMDGNDMWQVLEIIDEALRHRGSPTVIVAKTVKGKGVSFMENNVGFHGKAPNREEYEQAMRELGGPA
jgi:transketolase